MSNSLGYMNIVNIAVLAVNLAINYPKATIPNLNGFGMAGEALKKNVNFLEEESQKHLLTEIVERIAQIEQTATSSSIRGYKTKITKAARNARKQIKQ